MTPEPRTELAVDEIRELLAEVGRRLEAAGVHGTLYIVGGAAMALEFDARRVTVDVDAVLHPATTIKEVAAEIAAERGLPRRWLNDAARAFIPGGDEDAVMLDLPGIAVAVASPRHLLAMKLAAFRPGDMSDLELLFRVLDIRSAETAADLAVEVYGEGSVVLPEREELLLSSQAILDRLAKRRRR